MNRGDDMAAGMPQRSTDFTMIRRIMAGLEALILAGVFYLVAADQQRKEDMIILKTTGSITAQAVSNIPDLTIRMTQTESEIDEIRRRVGANEISIETVKERYRSSDNH